MTPEEYAKVQDLKDLERRMGERAGSLEHRVDGLESEMKDLKTDCLPAIRQDLALHKQTLDGIAKSNTWIMGLISAVLAMIIGAVLIEFLIK